MIPPRLLLKSLRFYKEKKTLAVPKPSSCEPVRLKPCQILLFITITEQGVEVLPENSPIVPALLDTGAGHTGSVKEEFVRKSGFFPKERHWRQRTQLIRDASGRTTDVAILSADIWIHCLDREGNPTADPHKLSLGINGLACYRMPSLTKSLGWAGMWRRLFGHASRVPAEGPRLPILGLGAMHAGCLKVEISCDHDGGEVNLYALDRRRCHKKP